MNIVVLQGRLVKDTELNQSGKMAYNTIAVDRDMKDANGNKQTDFINLKWLGDKKAQFAQKYLKKGTKITISGALNIDNYKDKDGNNKQSTSVIVNNNEFCESKGANATNTATNTGTGSDFMEIPDNVEGVLPFN